MGNHLCHCRELTKWTRVRAWGPKRLGDMAHFMSRMVTLLYSPHVATKWGEIQAAAHLRGRPRPVNDAWIAACCLVWQRPLVTYNVKDFEDFAEHDGLDLITG